MRHLNYQVINNSTTRWISNHSRRFLPHGFKKNLLRLSDKGKKYIGISLHTCKGAYTASPLPYLGLFDHINYHAEICIQTQSESHQNNIKGGGTLVARGGFLYTKGRLQCHTKQPHRHGGTHRGCYSIHL